MDACGCGHKIGITVANFFRFFFWLGFLGVDDVADAAADAFTQQEEVAETWRSGRRLTESQTTAGCSRFQLREILTVLFREGGITG